MPEDQSLVFRKKIGMLSSSRLLRSLFFRWLLRTVERITGAGGRGGRITKGIILGIILGGGMIVPEIILVILVLTVHRPVRLVPSPRVLEAVASSLVQVIMLITIRIPRLTTFLRVRCETNLNRAGCITYRAGCITSVDKRLC
jgi:hypothetical protein